MSTVAACDRAGERGRRPQVVDVVERRPHERQERLERHAGVGGQPLDLAEQRDEVVRRDARGRVVAGAVGVGAADAERAETQGEREHARRAAGRRPRTRSRRDGRGRASPPGNDWSGCSDPRSTSGRRRGERRRGPRASPRRRGGSRARPARPTARPRRATAAIAASGVREHDEVGAATGVSGGDSLGPEARAATPVEVASGARPATATGCQAPGRERERHRGPGATGTHERERSDRAARLGCVFHGGEPFVPALSGTGLLGLWQEQLYPRATHPCSIGDPGGEPRVEVGQRDQHERPLPHPGVGHDQVGLVDAAVADEQHVDVERPWAPALGPDPVGGGLEPRVPPRGAVGASVRCRSRRPRSGSRAAPDRRPGRSRRRATPRRP